MTEPIPPATLRRLEAAAREARKRAYAPYSGFRVGAAVLTDRGKIISGCNVENASFGLTNCAERTAIFSAVAGGAKRIRAVVIYTRTAEPTPPCGACRQVIRQFGPRALIVSICRTKQRLATTLDRLLPGAFDLKGSS